MKLKERMLNAICSLVVVVAFFGIYPREMQHEAPTIFALLSILVYTTNKKILDTISTRKYLKRKMEELEEWAKENGKDLKGLEEKVLKERKQILKERNKQKGNN